MARASSKKTTAGGSGGGKETAKTPKEPKRLNRMTGAGEAIGSLLDPVFKKRGFASRDIVTHWETIAPAPYNTTTAPEKLYWPRGQAGAEGAILYLRAAPGQALAVTHDGGNIARAVNRYFGYVLVGSVKLSAEPFSRGSGEKVHKRFELDAERKAELAKQTESVSDEGVREALRQLGMGLLARKR